MLRRKPTRVEDRADVAEEYELYLAAKEAEQQQRRGSTEDIVVTHSLASSMHHDALHSRGRSGSRADEMGKSLLPVARRMSRSSSSVREAQDAEDRSKTKRVLAHWRGLPKRCLAVAAVVGFVLGYYTQVIVFFLHVRMGFTGEILPTREVALSEKDTASLLERTKRVIFVCKKTNWDYIGFIATPHTVLFGHEDVYIPSQVEKTLSVVRHSGLDSYLNLHNKTLTIMSHVHRADPRAHLFKQDEEAVVFWPHYYQCMAQCKNIGTCYAGDMHVNIGDAANANSYVFATGGSYFVGNELLKCLLDAPVKVETTGLDHGEDKMVGKMIHYNGCPVQYVSCKWFNNREVYSPNAVVRMVKQHSEEIKADTVLLSEQDQKDKQDGSNK
ncbi:hypothetical protein PybrP1_000597 [[Pythium] brassicae (nom. inval.)]|nr:hypothetical protein PybrP1_000597 [[Pythium] brassicae (nom. inval.)]